MESYILSSLEQQQNNLLENAFKISTLTLMRNEENRWISQLLSQVRYIYHLSHSTTLREGYKVRKKIFFGNFQTQVWKFPNIYKITDTK